MAEQLEESQQLLDESIQIEEIEQYRSVFRKAEKEKNITESNKFSYAYCLIRSKKKGDVREGLTLLRELYESTKEDSAKRDYIFYMALGKKKSSLNGVFLEFSSFSLKATLESTNTNNLWNFSTPFSLLSHKIIKQNDCTKKFPAEWNEMAVSLVVLVKTGLDD